MEPNINTDENTEDNFRSIMDPEEGVEDDDEYDSEEEGLLEIPVKTELIEEDYDLEEKVHLIEESNASLCDIKAEPLEENYEDRVNDFLRSVHTSNTPFDGEEGDNNPTEDLDDDNPTNSHFLTLGFRNKRRNGNLTCSNCSTVFKYQSTYNYHVKSQCGTKMISEKDKLVTKNKKQSFTCNVCQKNMCSRTSLMVHMRIHTGERPFACDVCGRSFTQKAHLKDHMKIHLEGKLPKPLIYTCSECGKMFNEKKLLHSHMQLHFGDKLFDCSICHKRFRTRSSLRNHKKIHSDKKDYACEICGREFLRKPNLHDHMRTHTKEKPYGCDVCGKTFAEINRRNTHVKRLHTGELKEICSVCGKKFACSYDLRIHQRSHTGERPFSCNICGRMFNRKSIMETHMTIHTGRKDFVCTQCGEAFNRKSKLDIHVASSHTGEKFYCEICHRMFKCKAYLVPHIRTHIDQRRRQRQKSFNCILCHNEFPSRQQLEKHLTQGHPSLFQKPILLPPEQVIVKVESVE